MRVVFVALGQEQLGISLLSAVLRRAGFDTDLVFEPALFHDRYYFDVPILRDVFRRDERVVAEILAADPDVIAFSALTPMYTWSLDIARAVKEARPGIAVVFGGVHASAVPEVCLENDFIDYVCVGEGEEAFVQLCHAISSGRGKSAPIANIGFRDAEGNVIRGPSSGFIQDLDSLPHWDKELWEDKVCIADNYQTMTSRGCPYRCTFCFNNFWVNLPDDRKSAGKYVRQRSVAHCMDELRAMKRRYNFKRVEFHDDIFTLHKPWLKSFLDEYRRDIAVPFTCLVHARFIDDEVALWLKEAGCDRVQMGIQSADPEYKRKQLLRMERDVDLSRSLDAMTRVGLQLKLDHILGLPGEPASAQELARKLFAEHTPSRINTYWLSYMPGAEVTTQALANGHISQEQFDQLNRGHGRFFHHLAGVDRPDRESLSFYQRYDLLFRLLPLVPASVRPSLRAEDMPRLPAQAVEMAGFALDLVNAIARRDPEPWVYIKHYARQLTRVVPELLGIPTPQRARRPPPPRRPERPRTGHRLTVVRET